MSVPAQSEAAAALETAGGNGEPRRGLFLSSPPRRGSGPRGGRRKLFVIKHH